MIFEFKFIRSAIRSSEPLGIAVQMLTRAWQHAERAKCNPWHFAIDLDEFYRAGVYKFDLRFLLMVDLVEHAQEVIDFNYPGRKLKMLPKHIVPAEACFILSDFGLTKLSQLAHGGSAASIGTDGAPNLQNGHQLNGHHLTPPIETSIERLVPQWDAEQKFLRFNGVVVKQFSFPAPNQEAVLTAFQEENWPRRIDDPLHPTSEQDGRRRLNDTIRYLNQKMVNPFIRFCGDGTGTGVVWKLSTGRD